MTRASIRGRVTGAVAAQFSQALGSVLLQIQASRMLGSEGLATFAILYWLIVVATAVVTGFVGDSLTVLDRSNASVRAGLQRSLVALSFITFGVLAVVGGAWDRLGMGGAVLFGLAAVAFVVEDTPRRLLMACMRFWQIVIVDVVSLIGSVGFVAAMSLSGASVTIATFLWAIVIGQVLATVAAVMLLPASERWWARDSEAAWRTVWWYGRWRALQQSVRPLTLVVVRVVAVAAVGRAAYGEVEAARVFVGPAILLASGASSYLFSSFARERDADRSVQLRRADIGTLVLVLATLAMGGLFLLLVPQFGSLIDAGRFDIDPVAVLGWSAYSAAVAAITPYGMLAAVRARQSVTLVMRVAEALLSVAGVALVLQRGWPVATMPAVMAVATALTAVAVRLQLVVGRDVSVVAAPVAAAAREG